MAEYRQLEDGTFVKRRASGWEPVSAEEVEAAGEGRLERLATAALKGATSLGHGANELTARLYSNLPGILGDKAEEFAASEREARLADQAELEGLGQVDPAAAAGRFLPELFLGAGGGRVASGGIRGLAAAEGALGATVGAAANPDDPLVGAALGGALGAGGGAVLGGVGAAVSRLGPGAQRILDVATMRPGTRRGVARGRAIVEESRRMEPPLTAADAEAPGGMAGVGEGEITGPPGLISGMDPRELGDAAGKGWGARMAGIWDEAPDEALNREAAELGFRLTPGVARGSASMRQIEANLESTPGGASAFAELREQNDLALKGHLVKALGGEGTDLSPQALGQMKGQLGDTFEEVGQQIGDVDLKGALREINKLVDDIDDPDVEGWLGSIANKVPANMSGPSLMKKLEKYRRDADSQWHSQSGHRGKAEALDDLADIVEKHMLRQAPRQVGSVLEQARDRWRLLRTVERGGTITSDGELSPKSLNQALRGGYKNEYRYDEATDNADIQKLLRASRVAYSMRDIVGNSGTATRSQNPLSALTTGQVHRAWAKSYLEPLDLKDYAKAAGGLGGVAAAGYGASQIFGE